jgi:hypothetical protein
MAITFTSTAYSATPKLLVTGLTCVSFDYTTTAGASLSASANSAIVLGPKIPTGTKIVLVSGSHSAASATCPVDIGLDDTISAIASQKTLGAAGAASSSTLPFTVSVSDDAAVQYRVMKFGVTPGTDTGSVRLQYTVWYGKDV